MALTLGIVGGGQLARMMIAPAVELGIDVRVLAEEAGMSAALAATATGDYRDLATVQSMIGLAAAFRREVIAEGVETPRHRQALVKLGCHLVQGHGIARPMPAARMQRWMRAYATRH